MDCLRRAVLPDLDVLLAMVSEFYVLDRHDFDAARVREALHPLLLGDTVGQVWLILGPSADIAGYAVLTWGYSLESGGREGLVDELYVRPRGTGLGGRALGELAAQARRAGCRVLFLETEAHNDRARRFYARHAFDVQTSIWLSRVLDGQAVEH
jgi:GNAT superfamily N-acetyltransferase